MKKKLALLLATCALLVGALVMTHNDSAVSAADNSAAGAVPQVVTAFRNWNGGDNFDEVLNQAKSFSELVWIGKQLDPVLYIPERKKTADIVLERATTLAELREAAPFLTSNPWRTLDGYEKKMAVFYAKVVSAAKDPGSRRVVCDLSNNMQVNELQEYLKTHRAPDGRSLIQYFGCGQ